MTDSPHAPPSDRSSRTPQQERGQRRFEQILDAAESVFYEHGVDGASMQMIADRAESSVGSLYHFFPSKDAIVQALGDRYTELVRATNERAMPFELAHHPAPELFDRILRAHVELIAESPAFDAVHQAVHRHYPAIYDSLNHALVDHVGRFLALRYPTMPEPDRAASAMTSVATVHAVVELASRVPPALREGVIRQSHAMLATHFGALDARYGQAARS